MATIRIMPTNFVNGVSYTAFTMQLEDIGGATDGNTSTSVNISMSDLTKSYHDIEFTEWDTSGIPQGSTINSVAVTWIGYTNNAARFNKNALYARIGTTNKISETDLSESTSSHTTNLAAFTCTLAELTNSFNVYFSCKHDSYTSGTYYLQEVYADVDYTPPEHTSGQTLYSKVNGAYTPVSAVYKKINGAWVQQTDLLSLFDTSKHYQMMEYIPPETTHNLSITSTGTLTANASINGTSHTLPYSGTVEDGTSITVTITLLATQTAATITINGTSHSMSVSTIPFIGGTGTYTFTMPAQDTVVTVAPNSGTLGL